MSQILQKFGLTVPNHLVHGTVHPRWVLFHNLNNSQEEEVSDIQGSSPFAGAALTIIVLKEWNFALAALMQGVLWDAAPLSFHENCFVYVMTTDMPSAPIMALNVFSFCFQDWDWIVPFPQVMMPPVWLPHLDCCVAFIEEWRLE